MMTLSREWTIISALMYGQKFIEELVIFLRQFGVQLILECGCGGGHVLEGLAKHGFGGVGIDSNAEMVSIAKTEHSHPAIEFQLLNWLETPTLGRRFDAVICRGNSLISVASWENGKIPEAEECQRLVIQSLRAMLSTVKEGGLLYLDTISQAEIDQGGGQVSLDFPDIHLEGEIIHDWTNRKRTVMGSGMVRGEYFTDESTFYLTSPDELAETIRTLGVRDVLRPKIATEINYDIICAIK